MGTNYYIRYNVCEKCHRSNELHIGKSSVGWSFSFHAVSEYIDMSVLDPKHALIDSGEELLEIKSYTQWKEFIDKYVSLYKTAYIYNEYDEMVSPLELYKLVEKKREGKRHFDFVKYDMYSSPDLDFLDEEGNSFSKHEFS